ncbi:MAG: PD-(D/E)XK nuclease family protein [Lachnospiraceae bacterium]|nr:PD-(D/E)XK nuclease family protein [Lachnospiraceae bacterium]
MAITFITGPAHAGKTTYIYRKIAADAKKEPDRNFFVIVPEQYTLSTQKKLTSLSGGAILNIDVLSFARLTHRIFEELGLGRETVLEDTGKNLLLRKVINEHADELKVLKGDIKRMGYVDEIKSLLTELDQYRISADELENMAEEADTVLLSAKLKDMALIKRAFDEKCEGGYITSEQILEKLAGVAAESEKLNGAVFVFDGFTGFTPVQMYFLRHLLLVAGDIYMTLTIDDPRSLKGLKVSDIPENDLFLITEKCYVSLKNLAVKTGQTVNPDIEVKDGNIINSTSKDIRFLGDTIYRPGKKAFDGKAENIHIMRFQTPVDELYYVAAEIKRLVRTGGFRYRDFAVICGDDTYFSLAHRVFSQYEVPVFIDEKKSTSAVPIVAFLKNIFNVTEKNYAIDAVMDLVRTSLTPLGEDECDRLENYLFAKGIKSRWKWEKTWDDEEMNGIRKMLNSTLGKLPKAARGGEKTLMTAGEITKILYSVMDSLGVSDRIYDSIAAFEAEENISKASEYEKCYEAVMDILDKIYEFLGDEKMDLAEYTEILSAGLDRLTLGVIPQGSDYVTVGDIERSRLSDIKVLFITGAAEGNIPHTSSNGGILSQIERQSINDANLRSETTDREQLPTDRERALSGRFYIMDAVCKPTDELYFSYAGVDSEGKSHRRSYLLDLVERKFEGLKETVLTDDLSLIQSVDSCKKYVYEGLSVPEACAGDEEWKGALSAYLSVSGAVDALKNDLARIFRENYGTRLGAGQAEKLYGKVLYGSVSNLETFAGCAYSYFLRYGLRLKDRDVLEFDTIKMGTLLHEAIDEFCKQVSADGVPWQEKSAEDVAGISENVFSGIEAGYREKGYFENEQEVFQLNMIKDLYKRTIDILGFQLKQGSFSIAGSEYGLDSMMDLSRGKKMHFRGSADRVDVFEKGEDIYVKILDLKSYNNDLSLDRVYYGIQLQLMTYVHEAMLEEARKHGKKAHFGGAYYYDMEDPVVDAPSSGDAADEESPDPDGEFSKEEEEMIDTEIKKKQKLSGIHSGDIDVVKAIDKDFGAGGLVLKGSANKDNVFYKNTKVLSEDDYNTVDSFVMNKLRSIGDDILDGKIDRNPYYMKKKKLCDRCDYRNICDFDRDLGDEFRWLYSMDDGKTLEAMKRENEKKDNVSGEE